MNSRRVLTLGAAASFLALTACSKQESAPEPVAVEKPAAEPSPVVEGVTVDTARLGIFGQLPATMESASNPITEEKVKLGRMLYFDTRLSKNQDVSCNSCHNLDTYGVDNQPTSTGHKAQKGGRNSPTVYNAAAHFVQFWDGRAGDVEAQAKGPILNPVEMAMKDEKAVLKVINSIPEYVEAFKAAFPEEKQPVSYDNLAKAIGAFERKLVTPSRFDKFLAGDASALTDEEKKGLNLFLDTGCTTCHMGATVGGMMYQKLGLVKPWPDTKDLGRFDQTKNEADKQVFKVPSLRNIEKTAPYFHDGSVTSLTQAIKLMGDHQLGKTLDDAQAASIEAFLKSLTGDLPKDYIVKPELPASTAKTPKADPS